jgi:hypothetical protein
MFGLRTKFQVVPQMEGIPILFLHDGPCDTTFVQGGFDRERTYPGADNLVCYIAASLVPCILMGQIDLGVLTANTANTAVASWLGSSHRPLRFQRS